MKVTKVMAIGAVAFWLVACSTVPTKMENLSPEQGIPAVAGFETIPGVVLVRSENPSDLIAKDVVLAINQHRVFAGAVLERPASGGTEFEMVVKSTSKSDHHFADGMGKAVLSGLTFGLASSSQVDPFDYEVTVEATVTKGGKSLARYKTMGRYHSEVAASAPLYAKTERVNQAVAGSFSHALSLLVAKIKLDRELYVAPPPPRAVRR